MKNPSMDHFKGATWSEFASFMNKVSQMAFRPELPLLSHPHLQSLHFSPT